MDSNAVCPQCGAANEVGVRRCRICAELLDLSVPEEPVFAPVVPAVPKGASSEDISRAAGAALREERLRRRPGFLDRVLRARRAGDGTGSGEHEGADRSDP
jgi:hypothetical protein